MNHLRELTKTNAWEGEGYARKRTLKGGGVQGVPDTKKGEMGAGVSSVPNTKKGIMGSSSPRAGSDTEQIATQKRGEETPCSHSSPGNPMQYPWRPELENNAMQYLDGWESHALP